MTDASHQSSKNRVGSRAGSRTQKGEAGLSDGSERMAKYKEERRRQIRETVCEKQLREKESTLGLEPPALRRSQRLATKQKSQDAGSNHHYTDALRSSAATSQVASSADEKTNPAYSALSRRRYIARDESGSANNFLGGKVRLTKAARLRAEANSSQIQASQVLRNGLTHQDSLKKVLGSSDAESKPNSALLPAKTVVTDVNYNVTGKSAEQSVRSAESDYSSDLSLSRSASGGEKLKDKSAKRKSNLNRATVLDGQGLVPSDLPNPRRPRRLRRTSESSGSDKVDPRSKRSTDISSQIVPPQHKSSDSQSDSKPASASNLKTEKQLTIEREICPLKKKVTALKKPEIPVVFRQRSLTPPRSNASDHHQHPRVPDGFAPLEKLEPKCPPPVSSVIPVLPETPIFRRDDLRRWTTNSKYSSKSKFLSEKSSSFFSPIVNGKSGVAKVSTDSVEKLSDVGFASATEVEDEDLFFTPPETLLRETPPSVVGKRFEAAVVTTTPVVYTVSVKASSTIFSEETSRVVGESQSCLPTSRSNGIGQDASKNMQTLTSVGDATKELNFKEESSTVVSSFHRVEEIVDYEASSNDVSHSKKPFPILKRKSLEEKREDIQGILRLRSSREDSTEEPDKRLPSSILKKRGSSEEKEIFHPHSEISTTVHPILKRQSTEESSDTSSPVHSILKHKSLDHQSDPKPILKKKSSMEEITSDPSKTDPKPILKKRSSTDEEVQDFEKPKPILKSWRRSEEEVSGSANIPARNRSDSDSGRRSILKKSDDDLSSACPAPLSPSYRRKRRDSDEILSDSSLISQVRNGSSTVRRLSMDNNYGRDDKVAPTSILKKRLSDASSVSWDIDKKDDQKLVVEGNAKSYPEEADVTENQSLPNLGPSEPPPFTTVSQRRSQFKVTSAEEPMFPSGRMQNRKRNPRYRTQPITMIEIQETDSLESVQAFRSRVLKNASLNLFEQNEVVKDNSHVSKKTEFPQHYKPAGRRKDRRTDSRYSTLPITLEEIQEAKKGVKADEDEDSENDPSKLSVMEKAKLFAMKIQASKRAEPPKVEGAPPTRRAAHHRGSRFQTQPVTTEEVRKLSGLMKSLQKPPEPEDVPAESGVLRKPPQFPISVTDVKHSLKNASSTNRKPEVNQKSVPPTQKKEAGVPPKPSDGKDSSSEESSSEEESNGEEDDSKKVLTGGQSHIVFNSYTATSHDAVRDTKKITNLAIQRKLNASIRKKEERRSAQTESDRSRRHELLTSVSTSALCDPDRRLLSKQQRDDEMLVPKRSPSQPLIDGEKGGLAGITIRDRLAALQKSGEESWRRRIKSESSEEGKTQGSPEDMTIASRKSQLEVSSYLWQNRVEVKDADQYTVAGKMGQNVSSSPVTPVLERKKKTPIPSTFKSPFKPPANAVMVMLPGFLPLSKSKSVPVATRDYPSEGEEEDQEAEDRRILVPRADNETFSSFFDSRASMSDVKVEISDEVFNEVASRSHQLLVQKRTVKMQQRRHAGTRNPIKALASRSDLRHGYVEEKTGVAEMELKRIKIEEMAKNYNKSVAAVAGLVSTVDFKAVSLRKSGTEPNLSQPPVVLMQVKGRRHVQTRLVEPIVKSVNHGDSYVLATPEAVYCWMGKFSNVIERAKVSEVASLFLLRKELPFKETAEVVTLDEETEMPENDVDKFFELLGGTQDDCRSGGPPDEDENYEASIIDTNMVYEVQKDELIPHDDYWGHVPKIEMLLPEKVFVFDFGSEMYVWSGKQAAMGDRKLAMRLAQQLWDHGYDYTECDINPIDPELDCKEPRLPKKDSSRPKWACLQRIHQNMEPVLFREKFLDWPNMAQIIQVKGQDSTEGKAEGLSDLKPCDVKVLLSRKADEPDLVLEGSHLGRGQEYWIQEEGRLNEITTLAVKMWHVMEYECRLLQRSSWGQFHMGDTYVFRWQYRLSTVGRELTGKMSRHSIGGRDRCAYFFWQGKESTITEKGASALMTVELDEEMGPHVRVVQGKEPPCFLSLFDGEMVVHIGKRELEETNTPGPFKFFMIRGELQLEVMLVEIERSANSLRSRSSFVLMNVDTGLVFIWHGAKSPSHTRRNVNKAINALIYKKPPEMLFAPDLDFRIEELEEGSESTEFWKALNGQQEYFSLLNSTVEFKHESRLFHLSSISGSFEATEILCSFRTENYVQAFPFLQSELYGATQPALFLLDHEYEVYVWQGWWPEGTEETDNVATGSAQIRWNFDRRCAMETTLQYCQEKCPSSPPQSFLISAGLEPLEFTNLFPEWVQKDDIVSLQTKEGKRVGEKRLVKDVLVQLSRTHYPIEDLQTRPLPEGVDPLRLEAYIVEEEFEELFGMSKEVFYRMPSWKKNDYKKSLNLF